MKDDAWPDFQAIAKELKLETDKLYAGRWQVACGRSFGSFITFKTELQFFFKVPPRGIYFLVWQGEKKPEAPIDGPFHAVDFDYNDDDLVVDEESIIVPDFVKRETR